MPLFAALAFVGAAAAVLATRPLGRKRRAALTTASACVLGSLSLLVAWACQGASEAGDMHGVTQALYTGSLAALVVVLGGGLWAADLARARRR